ITSLLFPPLAAGTRAAELVVDQVVAVEQVPEARLVVPIGGKRPGERIALGAQPALGPYTAPVQDARIIQDGSQRRPAPDRGAGGTVDGRRLLGPEQVRLDGQDGLAFNQFPPPVGGLLPGPLGPVAMSEGVLLTNSWGEAEHPWVISDPLPRDLGAEVTIV